MAPKPKMSLELDQAKGFHKWRRFTAAGLELDLWFADGSGME